MILKLRNLFVLFLLGQGQISFCQIYSNGNLSTGSISASGVNAPNGYVWSELQNNTGNNTQSNGVAGFPAYYFSSGTTSYRLADDFVVPVGETWNVSSFDFFGYDVINNGNTSPIDVLRVQIYNVNPSTPGATPIFGNMTSNVYDGTNTVNAFTYRIFNTVIGSALFPDTNSKVWKFRGNLNASLPAGTYWVEFQVHGIGDSYVFFPSTTIVGSRGSLGANAKIHTVASTTPSDVIGWSANLLDVGNPTSAPDVAQEIPFMVNGTVVLSNVKNTFNSSISIAPNPVKSYFNLYMSNDVKVNEIEIYDVCGRLIRTVNVDSDNNPIINIEDLKSGNYLLKLKTDDLIISKIIIKE